MNTYEVLAKTIVDAAFQIHYKLGPGLLEAAYEAVFAHELAERNISFERQKVIPIEYGEIIVNPGFRADFIVESKIIVELKCIERTAPVHKKQVLTYLRLTGLKLGFLLNFGEARIKDGITRIVNKL